MRTVLAFLFLVFSLTASSQSNVCFNRLHSGFVEILIPVSHWNGSSVTIKAVDTNGWLALAPATLNTSTLPKVTSTNGTEYYYIKRSADYGNITLVFEVSSPTDVPIKDTLQPLPQSQWNNAGTADICGVEKADICFSSQAAGCAEILIPVSQWNSTNVTVGAVDTNGWLALSPVTYTASSLPKVTATNGVQYYYIKQYANNPTVNLVFTVSSLSDAAVSYLLTALPQSQWNTAGTANICGVEKADICFNRSHNGFSEIFIPVTQWHGTSVTLAAVDTNGWLALSPVTYNTNSLPKVTNTNGTEYYYIKQNANNGSIKLVYTVSSPLDAAVSNLLAVLPQSQWNDFALQNTCFNKVKGICMNRNNANYTVYIPKAAWNDVEARVKIYHANGVLLVNELFQTPPEVMYNGVLSYKLAIDYAQYTNENVTIEVSSNKNAAVHMFLTPVQQLCYEADTTNTPAVVDWTLAPNSYIFTGKDTSGANVDGLYIPVKKAYAMWEKGSYIGGDTIPEGTVTACVLWEDAHGLIKSGEGYNLSIDGTGKQAKIRIPVNKSMKGNAVIALKVNGNIYWSWHVWVTDDPTKGSVYKSFDGVARQNKNGTVEQIPDAEWGWMDRNLGALGSSITAGNWNKNGGLLYQWGRKDPLPPLVDKGNDFYEVTGSIGRVRHRGAQGNSSATVFDNLTKYIKLSDATVTNNIRLTIKNPLGLIYVNKDDNSGQAFYGNNANNPVNWFGTSGLPSNRLTELNLWSDNSKGLVMSNYNNDNQAKPYQDKSSYDPCPNGWRVPSMLVANTGNGTYEDDIRIDFSPFGVRTNMATSVFQQNSYHKIKPTDNSLPDFIKGFKIYLNTGMDLSNVGGRNMGQFPGTGGISRSEHLGQYTDQHETALWTATMTRWLGTEPAVSARLLGLTPDGGQPDIPDPTFPNVKGRYVYEPTAGAQTSDANACRCLKDPLYKVDGYNFPTEFFTENSYSVGMDNPNSYQVVKSASETVIKIPVSKAFSVQSQVLNNPGILNTSNFDMLKSNVLWSDKAGIISNISLSDVAPASLSALSNTNIIVKIAPNLSGNAVVTLHNGSTSNPVYWSWHIWVTENAIDLIPYTTDQPVSGVTNYVNYLSKGQILSTKFMDRNLGATEAFPTIAGDPLNPTANELDKIRKATGLQYQWGRKDPIPSFKNAVDRIDASIYLGSTDANGSVTYTALSAATYNNMTGNYIIPYNTYTGASNANVIPTDKISEKIAKILSYSVRNPLVYMIPSAMASFNNTNPNMTNGTDWLANEANLGGDRWGRANKKSVFDPCPQGWRIPDLTGVEIADYGVSPWYKKDYKIGDAVNKNIINNYLGVWVRRSNTQAYTIGYTFNNSNYKIGNYPNAGTRGYRSVLGNGNPTGTYNSINFQYPGLWTADLSSNYRGRPISILMNANTSAHWMRVYSDDNDPYFAMSCRCVQINYDEYGNEEGVIPRLPVQQDALVPATKAFNTQQIEGLQKENKITVFPNPVKDIVRIDVTDDREYHYQVYDMAGRMVKEGKFNNKETDLSSLRAGAYLIRINNSESVTKIIKQ